MKFIEYQQGIWGFFFNHFDVWHPHITADTLQTFGYVRAYVIKKLSERLFASAFTGPNQFFGLKIVNISKVFMAFSSGNFINADMGNAGKIPVFKSVCNNEINGCSHRSPGTLIQSSHLYPRQKPGPVGQIAGKGICKPPLSRSPGDAFNTNATAVFAHHPSW
jgi:hypothetical protein